MEGGGAETVVGGAVAVVPALGAGAKRDERGAATEPERAERLEEPRVPPEEAIAEERAKSKGWGDFDFLSVPMPLSEEEAMWPKLRLELRSRRVAIESSLEVPLPSEGVSEPGATVDEAIANSLKGKSSP